MSFTHDPHPHIEARKGQAPPKVADERVGINGRIGLWITRAVGTMNCAYAFMALSLISLPAAIATRDPIVIVAWIAQTCFQLILLPIIIVGQNLQGRAADRRAEQTYNDAEAILHENLQIQAHLIVQDEHLAEQDSALSQLVEQVRAALAALPAPTSPGVCDPEVTP
jgi:hypothetical protein